MIARIWRGAVRRPDSDEYAEYMRKTGVAAYAATAGNRGVWMLRREVDERTEFVMFTLWDSLGAVKDFTGEEYETAVFYPDDERFLIDRDLLASHYDVAAYEAGFDDRPAQLRGARVFLRPLELEDVSLVAAIQAEPDVASRWGPPDEAELRQQAEGRADEKALVIESDGELVGLIQYYEESEPDFRHAAIDIFLATAAQGRGLGPDAVRTLARYLIDDRGHHRLTIDPTVDNTPAIRAYEKVGFRPVGVMRKNWRSPEGKWRDGLLMDLLAAELNRIDERSR
jgi:aminoglycoside 6'-N-acetyltransferase